MQVYSWNTMKIFKFTWATKFLGCKDAKCDKFTCILWRKFQVYSNWDKESFETNILKETNKNHEKFIKGWGAYLHN